MPADLDLLGAFTDAITGETVALPGPRGQVVVPKEQFEIAFRELAELRMLQGGEDEGAVYAQGVVERLVDLMNQAEEQQVTSIPTQVLVDVLDPPEEEPEDAGPSPEMVETVNRMLQALGVNTTPETGEAFLDVLAQVSNGSQPGRHRAPEPEPEPVTPQQLLQAAQPQRGVRLRPAAKAAPKIPQHKMMPVLPANGIPLPASPPPFVPVTAEQLFGLQRNAGGKYDSGSIEQ